MNLGAEPKKVVILGVLLLVAGYTVYTNVLAPSGEETTSAAAPPVNPAPALSPRQIDPVAPDEPTFGASSRREAGGVQEFRPSLKRRTEDKIDPAKIDPTLELYRLAQLKEVAANSTGRNVFEFGAAAPPPQPDIKIVPKVAASFGPPKPPPPPTPVIPQPPPVPQAPPIPLKFYGFAQKDFEQRARTGGPRRGLFIKAGEEIFVASEGDLIDKRYKVVRIQDASATLEDTQFNKQQTIPIEQVPGARE